MRHLVLTLSLSLLTVFISCVGQEDSAIKIVTAEEMQSLFDMEGVQLIDIRTPEEYNEGHIKNFQNINFYADDFEKRLESLDKTKPVVIHCRSGHRSGKCAKLMKEKGFLEIYDFTGGILVWEEKDLKLITN